jgi:TolA-binding protein
MEKLKDPAMILAITANIGVVGTSAYFYKQLEAIRADLVKMSQTLTGVVRKLAEMEKGDQHKGEALHTLNDQVKNINQAIEDLPSFESIDNLDIDLNEIIAVLEENNIPIERPSQARRIRSGDRRDRPRRSNVMDDQMEAVRPESSARRNTSRTSDRSRTDDRMRSDDVRTPSRRETMRQPQSRMDPRTEPAQSYDEDDRDLIDIIRRQQTRN